MRVCKAEASSRQRTPTMDDVGDAAETKVSNCASWSTIGAGSSGGVGRSRLSVGVRSASLGPRDRELFIQATVGPRASAR
ncbi:unnamed protein product [Pleuronectes platessa]|uniref:Uncharacterized protein n=1 Tax=Pleuronectes platessa TaxID=8262 RepID=A0A9N7USG9_PLEPL|nr:unnamed protein product [Pleuronectes platessa]